MANGIQIETDALRWARERHGLEIDVAAKKLGINGDRLLELEEGVSQPSSAQLREAAAVYKVSPASFFLPSDLRPKFQAPTDFRTLSAAKTGHFSPELREQINRIQAQRRILQRLLDDDIKGREKERPVVLQSDAIESTARKISSWLSGGASDVTDESPADASAHLDDWIERIESRRIFVTQVSGIDLDEMRGFCMPDSDFPIIVLNGADAPTGRLFTLLHELVHLLTNQSGICNDPESEDVTERRCNTIAAAILMPDANVRTNWTTFDLRSRQGSITEALRLGARPYGVSPEALMRRFVSLGLATFDEYMNVRRLLQAEFAAKPQRQRKGGPSREVMIVRNLGRRYVEAVIDARRRSEISDFEAAQYLFAKVRWLDPVEQQLAVG